MNKRIFTGVLFVVLIVGVGFLLMPKDLPKQQSSSQQSQGQLNNAVDKGKKLAGNTSSYYEFTQDAYVQAVADGKIVFLDFYADWCPICRAEAPEIQAGFDSLQTDNVVGFRVNFNDNNTDEDEKKIAEKFDVPYQHTKIILKEGKEILRSGDQWDKETFLREITNVVK